jgi:hypothetical protein
VVAVLVPPFVAGNGAPFAGFPQLGHGAAEILSTWLPQ